MAQVAVVYSIKRHERTAEDIVAPLRHVHDAAVKPAPKTSKKRVWASIKKPMEGVNSDVFDEALARDPEHKKWVWLSQVDGHFTRVKCARRAVSTCSVRILGGWPSA